MQLHEVPHIRLNAEFEIRKITNNDFDNYFRTFKPVEETLKYDCIYSPFFGEGIFVIGDDYADRMDKLQQLKSKVKGTYISLYLVYDFSNTPVNLSYKTGGEFKYIGKFLDEAISKTNLYLVLLLSHFRQFGDKSGTFLKPEHYHCLIGSDNSDIEFICSEMNKLADILKENGLFKIKIKKVGAKNEVK